MKNLNKEFGMKRSHERKSYIADIVFSHNSNAYRGTLKDISLGGVFIISDNVNLFDPGDLVTVIIPYTSGKKHVKHRGRIQWMNDEGFAIEFY